jgi:hypothetical protein
MTDEECKKRLAQLEEENRDLRHSSEQFGRLAERLNSELREERRTGIDRRHAPRDRADRRGESAHM